MGGLVVAQLFTLYSAPPMYLILDRLRRRKKGAGRMQQAYRVR